MDDRYDKNSYENSYDSDYGMRSYDKKPYDNSYGQDYQSDYKKKNDSSYGKDRDYDKSKKDDSSKSVSINKFNCINTNININGNNTGDINLGNKSSSEKEGYAGAYSSADGSGDEGYYDGQNYKKNDKGFDCIIKNNNNNTNINSGGNQTRPPEPPKATLNVTKLVTCVFEPTNGASTPPNPCSEFDTIINESSFVIRITDDNPVPSQFNGSVSGTNVTLGAGNYEVRELIPPQPSLPGYTITRTTTFDGDCTPNDLRLAIATGTIGAGEYQECNIENSYTITGQPGILQENSLTTNVKSQAEIPTFSSSPSAPAIGDSSDALEKITKLKQQWLELLP